MHAVARIIFNLKPRDHVTSALKTLHWLPVKHRIQFKLCLLMQLVINIRAPTYLQDLLTTASIPGHASNCSASNNDLIQQSTRLKLGERTFSVAAPCIWNSPPTQHKTTTNTVVLKCNLSLQTPTHIEDCTGLPVFRRQQHKHCIIALYCITHCYTVSQKKFPPLNSL